ncbi:phosphatidate cytidylyltransferase [Pseudomaricurvus sp. HS19]|uniref:phosphatidate cytidylyltransferase n=1 Tax=Pseudomaricurvus sp. HS19 TaxID=2692626 RepID=UPI00136E0CD4|nr:phosphatidate cytidylyltransferase [Pseudomaricurvus sp. HS19]MYM64977.1 phosphatidate cytidylyltransferase [Pseudomaricurvus sp. HS19]
MSDQNPQENNNVLKQRVITALVLAAVLLAALFGLAPGVFVLGLGLVVLLAAWEWSDLASIRGVAARLSFVGLVAASLLLVAALTGLPGAPDKAMIRNLLLGACTWWALALLWVQGYPSSAVLWGNPWVKSLMGLLVLVPTWLGLALVRGQANGEWLIVLLVLVVVCADVGAYFSGRAFGKRKLATEVSPGKTWEGFWGGVACCALLGLVVGYGVGGGAMMLALVVPAGLASVLGDLLESMVKRQRGVKDSGTLLPGHGGVLDRVDSITAAAPVFALALLLSGWQGA